MFYCLEMLGLGDLVTKQKIFYHYHRKSHSFFGTSLLNQSDLLSPTLPLSLFLHLPLFFPPYISHCGIASMEQSTKIIKCTTQLIFIYAYMHVTIIQIIQNTITPESFLVHCPYHLPIIKITTVLNCISLWTNFTV